MSTPLEGVGNILTNIIQYKNAGIIQVFVSESNMAAQIKERELKENLCCDIRANSSVRN